MVMDRYTMGLLQITSKMSQLVKMFAYSLEGNQFLYNEYVFVSNNLF